MLSAFHWQRWCRVLACRLRSWGRGTRVFIVVDGIDGAGKTTLVQQLATQFAGLDPVVTKEPTDASEWGRALRSSATRGRMACDQEIEYFHKDRLHHLRTLVKPALAAQRLVICDRYVDSTLAFQGRSPADADIMYDGFLPDIVVPDITLILDCPVDTGLARIRRARSKLTAFEDLSTLERAREIYRTRQGPHYVHIDASRSIEDTFRQACTELNVRFPHLRPFLSECTSSVERDRAVRAATA